MRNLDASWITSYMSSLKALGRKHKDTDEAKSIIRVLQKLSDELYIMDRGEAWIPEPGKNGYYPIMDDVPYAAVKTAVRMNTKDRAASWNRVAASAEPFYPLVPAGKIGGISEAAKRRLMAAAMVSLPAIDKRHESSLLGRLVPGMFGQRARKSIVGEREMREAEMDFRMCYEDGFKERLRGAQLRVSKAWRNLKHLAATQVYPAAVKGGVEGLAQGLHTEIGLPPTLLEMKPVRRLGMRKDFDDFSSMQLRDMLQRLEARREEASDWNTRDVLRKRIEEIISELEVRQVI